MTSLFANLFSQMEFSLSFVSVSHRRDAHLTIKEIPSLEDIFVVFELILKNNLHENVRFPGKDHDFGNFYFARTAQCSLTKWTIFTSTYHLHPVRPFK